MRIFSFEGVLASLDRTVRTFPLTVVSCFFVTLVASILYLIEVGVFDVSDRLIGTYTNVLFVVIFAAPLLLGVNFASRDFGHNSRVNMYVLSFALLLALYFFLPVEPDDYYLSHAILIFAANVAAWIFATYAPFLKKSDNEGLWQFTILFWARIGLTFIFAIVLFLGLLAALSAFDVLIYSFSFYDDLIFFAWLFSASVFGPLFFLDGVPDFFGKTLKKSVKASYPAPLKYLSKFLLTPLVTVYLLILYVYGAKIILTREWPEGFVSSLILSFCLIGIVTVFLLHPLTKVAKEKWMHKVWKWFFPAVLPLLILLALALYLRISEYGVTETRYFGVAIGIWLLVTCVYFIFSKKQDLRFFPVSLIVGCVIAAIGPLSATHVSLQSQMGRLESLLMEADVFENGKIAQQDSAILNANEVKSIIQYVSSNHSLGSLQPWFDFDVAHGDSYETRRMIFEMLSLTNVNDSYRRRFEIEGYREYNVIDVRSYSTLLDLSSYCSSRDGCYDKLQNGFTHDFEGDMLTIVKEGNEVFVFSFDGIWDGLVARHGYPTGYSLEIPQEDMTFETEGGKILFESITFKDSGESASVESYAAILLLK